MMQLDSEIFLEYKIVIKELLFNGADRQAVTKDGQTALGIVESHVEVLSDTQFKSLMFIL